MKNLTANPVLLFYRIFFEKNDCQTGIAFLGYIGYDATTEEILDYTNQEDYVASYPFLKNGTIVDAGGYEVFAIVPASDWSISVYSSEMTEDAVYKDYLDFPLYEVHLMK